MCLNILFCFIIDSSVPRWAIQLRSVAPIRPSSIGGCERYLALRGCKQSTLNAWTVTLFLLCFRNSHIPNHRKKRNASRFPLKSSAKVHNFLKLAKFYFVRHRILVVKKRFQSFLFCQKKAQKRHFITNRYSTHKKHPLLLLSYPSSTPLLMTIYWSKCWVDAG